VPKHSKKGEKRKNKSAKTLKKRMKKERKG